jgi:hypothetical protein
MRHLTEVSAHILNIKYAKHVPEVFSHTYITKAYTLDGPKPIHIGVIGSSIPEYAISFRSLPIQFGAVLNDSVSGKYRDIITVNKEFDINELSQTELEQLLFEIGKLDVSHKRLFKKEDFLIIRDSGNVEKFNEFNTVYNKLVEFTTGLKKPVVIANTEPYSLFIREDMVLNGLIKQQQLSEEDLKWLFF